MNIKQTFLELTSKTYPHGFETELESFLPKGFTKDAHGNYFYEIGNTKTAFTSHLDTACQDQVNVKHVFEGNYIKTDGKSILGADDKAGVTILLYMIEKNVPGLYCFFIGEEVGCIGSGLASNDDLFKNFDRMISFDRRGTTSVITHQSSQRCCSEDFAKELAKQLNKSGLEMKLDDTGVYTDSAEFVGVIPECTNISVGYYSEHTKSEKQDIDFLTKLCEAVVRVDWESLPTRRNPKVKEYKNSGFTKRRYTSTNQRSWYTGYDEYDYPSKSYGRSEYDYYEDYSWYEENSSKSIHQIDTSKKGKKYWEDLDHELWDEDVEEKSFFNYEVESNFPKTKQYYESLKQIIFEDKMTKEEFERLKHMYVDLSDPEDLDFYLEIRELL